MSFVGFRQSREVQKKLLDLYVSPHMSSSVKLHVIVALDQTTRLKEGLDWLLGRHHVQVASTMVPAHGLTASGDVKKELSQGTSAVHDKEDSEAGHLTGYQLILNIMSTKQVITLTSLLIFGNDDDFVIFVDVVVDDVMLRH